MKSFSSIKTAAKPARTPLQQGQAHLMAAGHWESFRAGSCA